MTFTKQKVAHGMSLTLSASAIVSFSHYFARLNASCQGEGRRILLASQSGRSPLSRESAEHKYFKLLLLVIIAVL